MKSAATFLLACCTLVRMRRTLFYEPRIFSGSVWHANSVKRQLKKNLLCHTVTSSPQQDLHPVSGNLGKGGAVFISRECKAGVSNSIWSEGQMNTYKVTRRPHYEHLRAASWHNGGGHCRNNGGSWTLLETAFPCPAKSYRHFISSRLYITSKGTCSLFGRALLNTGD